MITERVETMFSESLGSRMVGGLALPFLKRLRKDLAPETHNGASLLGLQGIVIKSHGAADQESFQSAIRLALVEVQENLPEKLHGRLASLLS